MKVLSVILGVILIICGFSCAFTPLSTFISAGFFIAAMLLVYGIAGIIRAVTTKIYGLDFVVSILGTVIGVIALFKPGTTLAIDALIVYLTAFFFTVQGIVSIIMSIKLKKLSGDKRWIWGIVTGILSVIVGIYSFIHPMAAAITVGLLLAIYFIESGFNMIFLAIGSGKGGAQA